MPIFIQISLPMKSQNRIRTAHLLKVAMLVAFLVVLPRINGYLNLIDFGSGFFSEATLSDILLRMSIFFAFSLVILELNVNGQLLFPKIHRNYKIPVIFLLNVALVFLAAGLFRFLHPRITQMEEGQNTFQFFEAILFAMALVLAFISSIIRLQKTKHDKIVENAELQQQNLHKELAALKNQVNPHFLFNSLNSLNALVRENKEASTFVKNLSFLYRYILQSGELDWVTVEEELRFVKSYLDLLGVRYRDKIKPEVDIDETVYHKKIPPLALQLLAENAIKHNEISEKNPLEIKLYSTKESLVIENKIRPRKSFTQSTGIGLSNLGKRYQLLMGKDIAIKQHNGNFSVELPLMSTNESSNR